MFKSSRPLPKSATTSTTPSRPVPTIAVKPKISIVPPPSSPLSSIASSSGSSPANASNGAPTLSKKPRIQLTHKTVAMPAPRPPAATAAAQPRTINKYSAPPPKPQKLEEKQKKKKGMLRGLSSDEEDDESEEDERPRKKVRRASSSSASSAGGKGRLKVNGANSSRAASPLRQQHTSTLNGALPSSSPLSSLPSSSSDKEEESESDLSSVDEDYFARTLKREDGGAIAVRDPSARPPPDGARAELGRSGEWLVVNDRGAYRECAAAPLAHLCRARS